MPSSPNQQEQIDIRILRLIGLEDVFDLDYGTYLSLLKEVMVKGRMTKTSIPTEEIELVTQEFKRVKSKKDKGRFKVKAKKISVSKLTGGSVSSIGGSIRALAPSMGSALVAVSKKTTGGGESDGDILTEIKESLDKIAGLLIQQMANLKAAGEKERRAAENKQRQARETRLEKGFAVVSKIAKKIVAPVKSILDRIINFFVMIFLGKAVLKLLDWFGDPKNSKKIDAIFRFLGDHWPKLIGAYLAFGTSFGRFITKLSVRLLRAIATFALRNPKLAAIAGAVALGGALINYFSKNNPFSPQTEKQAERTPAFYGGGPVNVIQVLNTGGFVSGQKGIDKIPAMLTDGEFVMSRGAVQQFGLDTLLAMNAAGGGTNRPRMVSGVSFAQGGGPIGKDIPPKRGLRPESAKTTLMGGNPFLQSGLARGTRATVGFTGMGKPGFDAISAGANYIQSNKPQILGRGAYSAPTYQGAMRYAGAQGSLGGSQVPGGVIRSIVPGGASRIPFLEPQMKVSPQTFDRGRVLAEKLQQGYRPNSALANRLRGQMASGVGRMPKFRMSGLKGNLLSAIPLLLQFAPGPVGERVRAAYDQQDRDKEEVMQMGMNKLNILIKNLSPTSTKETLSYQARRAARRGGRSKPTMRFAGGPAPNTPNRSYNVPPPIQNRTRVRYINTPSGASGGEYSAPATSTREIPSFSAVIADSRRNAKAAQLGIG